MVWGAFDNTGGDETVIARITGPAGWEQVLSEAQVAPGSRETLQALGESAGEAGTRVNAEMRTLDGRQVAEPQSELTKDCSGIPDDPGWAVARGLFGHMGPFPGRMPPEGVLDEVASVSAPPDDSARVTNAALHLPVSRAPELSVTARAALVETSATDTPSAASASAALSGIEIDTPAGVLALDVAGSQVSCPVGGPATAAATSPTKATLDGQAIDLTELTRRTVTIPSLGDARARVVIGTGPSGTQRSQAMAGSVFVGIFLEDETRDADDWAGVGHVVIAATQCQPPSAPKAAPTASSLSPASGSTEGGTEVTVTGTHFVPGATTVTIGGTTVPQDRVTVGGGGTSLNFVTPAHDPGAVEIVVTNPAGSSRPLTYTYATPVSPTVHSGPQVAFQANTGTLWSAGTWGAGNTSLGMMPGTSPSLVVVNGGYQVAFQANTGRLWTTGALGTRDLGLGMMAGTSPSITAVDGGSGYQVAFQANTGRLWTTGARGTTDSGLGMKDGTSPSITTVGSGVQVAFQANTGRLWTTGARGTTDSGLGMKDGTSPSITTVGSGAQVAFQANTTSLWTTGALGTEDRRLGMAAGTSPSITTVGSGAQVAFQANTTSLWTTGALGTEDRRLGMAAGTSPSITTVGSGAQVGFQANTTSLWTTGAVGTVDTNLGMMRQTSPDL